MTLLAILLLILAIGALLYLLDKSFNGLGGY